jgi:hypothetical protein
LIEACLSLFARSTIQDRRAGRQSRGQEEVKHARLTRYQEDVWAKYIQNTRLQYAPVNCEQLYVVVEMLAQLNEPNACLGKNWLSRFLNRHPDLKTSCNCGLDSKRITAAIPSQIEGWFSHVNDIIQRFNILAGWGRSGLYPLDARKTHLIRTTTSKTALSRLFPRVLRS